MVNDLVERLLDRAKYERRSANNSPVFSESHLFTARLLEEAAIRAAVPEGEPVAHQWRVLEDGEPRTSWEFEGRGDRPGWEALVKREPTQYQIETRPLYTHPAPRTDMERELAEARAEHEQSSREWRDAFDSMHQRAMKAEVERGALAAEKARLEALIRWAHDTLVEINPSSYDHDDVCKINDASVEVILGLAPTLGEKHGKSDEWWGARAALSGASIPAPDKLPPHMKFRRDAMLLAMTMDGGDFAGDLDPVDGNTVEGLARTLAIVAAAYDWTVDNDGSLAGLVGGDQGFASTRIVCKDAVSAPDKAEARREARQFLPTEDGEFNGNCPVDDRVPIAATDGRDVDWVDVTGWGVFKGHAIPVDVARFIAEKINFYVAYRDDSAALISTPARREGE